MQVGVVEDLSIANPSFVEELAGADSSGISVFDQNITGSEIGSSELDWGDLAATSQHSMAHV
eukprot:11831807-Prorocentrum_lima.AAC.1